MAEVITVGGTTPWGGQWSLKINRDALIAPYIVVGGEITVTNGPAIFCGTVEWMQGAAELKRRGAGR